MVAILAGRTLPQALGSPYPVRSFLTVQGLHAIPFPASEPVTTIPVIVRVGRLRVRMRQRGDGNGQQRPHSVVALHNSVDDQDRLGGLAPER